MLGSTSPTDGDSTISQSFTASGGQFQLIFYYKMTCPDTVTSDWMTVVLVDNTDDTTWSSSKVCEKSTVWTQVTTSVISGHPYTLTFINHDDNYPSDASYTLFDNIILSSTIYTSVPSIVPSKLPTASPSFVPSLSPLSPGTIGNPSFQNGLSYWTSTGSTYF